MDEDEKARDELIERFKQALHDPDTSEYFDEDDLVEIFDYAGDNLNDYLRVEALLWGARYFPDSDVLRERRGVLYNDLLSASDVQAFVRDSGYSSTLTRLVALRAQHLDDVNARASIKQVLADTREFSDEEVIQLVSLAEETGNLDWLDGNKNLFLPKIPYKPTFYYEIAAAYYDGGDMDKALPRLETLTQEMPYNIDAWTMYAGALQQQGKHIEALDALEMALAIKPGHEEAVHYMAVTLNALGMNERLRELYELNPDNLIVAENYFVSLVSEFEINETPPDKIDFLDELVNRFPESEMFLRGLVLADPRRARPYLRRRWVEDARNYGDIVFPRWMGDITKALTSSDFTSAYELALVLSENCNVETIDWQIQAMVYMVQASLIVGQYQRVIELVEKLNRMAVPPNTAVVGASFISLLKLNRIAEMRALYEKVKTEHFSFIEPSRVTEHFAVAGLVQYMEFVLRLIGSRDSLTRSEIDNIPTFYPSWPS